MVKLAINGKRSKKNRLVCWFPLHPPAFPLPSLLSPTLLPQHPLPLPPSQPETMKKIRQQTENRTVSSIVILAKMLECNTAFTDSKEICKALQYYPE